MDHLPHPVASSLSALICIINYYYYHYHEKKTKLDEGCSRMVHILNKSWKQHPTKQRLYCHLPPISKTVQTRRTRYTGHFWRSKDGLISDVLFWTSSHGHDSIGRLTRTYLQQFCTDTGWSLEDQPEAMDDRNEWRKRIKRVCAGIVNWLLLLFTPWEFFTSALADGFSLEFEWQRVSLSHQDPSHYSEWSQ